MIAFANAGTDTANCIKQAREFGLTQTLAGLLMTITVIDSLGLEVTQGLVTSTGFHWNLTPRARAFSDRLWAAMPNIRANVAQAGTYSAALHYLKVAAKVGVATAKADGAAMVARMKALPTDDDAFGPGRIREDGRKLHPNFLMQVKAPAAMKEPWDYMTLLDTIPAEAAFRPLAEGGCKLVKS